MNMVTDRDRLPLLTRARFWLNGRRGRRDARQRGVQPEAIAHSTRFRRVSTRYPHVVWRAFGGDLAAAARCSDAEVAAVVARWEVEHGLTPRDWSRADW